MITIGIPDDFTAERTYVIDVLFSEFLGLDYRIITGKSARDYEIILENSRTLLVRDHFFSTFTFKDGTDYLTDRHIPSNIMRCAPNRFSDGADVPVIFGTDELVVERDRIICGIDIFASSFFMLTRWEEYVNRSRDFHNRFPAAESLARKKGFLHRPVVNEYVEMLWSILTYLKCRQRRKEKTFRTIATHDVDSAFLHATKSPVEAIRRMGGDFIRRKDPVVALRNFSLWSRIAAGQLRHDPFNTFDHIMDVSERHGLQSTFLFMTDCGRPEYDGNYSITHRFLRRLLADIHARGHEIGLHSSYESFGDPARMKMESDRLKTVCLEEGIGQQRWLSRQHYLRWETPSTFKNLEAAGIDYDSTLSYAEIAGFRCGVCSEYPAFDILARCRLNVRERPLLVMECTVIDEGYMGLGTGEKAFSFIKSIKDTCRRFKGDFVILWHNTRLIDPRERHLYSQILQA